MLTRRALTLLLCSFTLLGCASQAQHLRSQPVVYMDITKDPNQTAEVNLLPIGDNPAPSAPAAPAAVTAATKIASLTPDAMFVERAAMTTNAPPSAAVLSTGEKQTLKVHCVRTPEMYNKDATSTGQCLYQAVDYVDVQNVRVRNVAERNRVIDLLVGISNDNCSTYRDRILANKAAIDTVKNSGKDIAAGIAAGTAKAAAGFSAGLGVFNLIGGSVLANFDQAVFSDKGIPGILAAIDSQREGLETTLAINRGMSLNDYSYQAAINDVKKYDHACSIIAALSHLSALAEAEKTNQGTVGKKVGTLLPALDNARTKRDSEQALLKQAQQKLVESTDPKQRESAQANMQVLAESVAASTKDVRKLEGSIQAAIVPAGATPAPAAAEKPANP